MPDLSTSLGFRYLQETKFNKHSFALQQRPRINPAPTVKTYPDADTFELPQPLPSEQGESNLWTLLQQRRSQRQYGSDAITLDELSLMLWAMQGVTAQVGPYLLRTAPSAGALYPIETYVAATAIKGIVPGIYHFNVKDFLLEQLVAEPVAESIAKAALNQTFIAQAPLTVIWSAVLRRNMHKYGHRGLRYILLDAGHICQNLLLAAEALGLTTCPIAAFLDDELNQLLGLDGEEESVLYLAALGSRDTD